MKEEKRGRKNDFIKLGSVLVALTLFSIMFPPSTVTGLISPTYPIAKPTLSAVYFAIEDGFNIKILSDHGSETTLQGWLASLDTDDSGKPHIIHVDPTTSSVHDVKYTTKSSRGWSTEVVHQVASPGISHTAIIHKGKPVLFFAEQVSVPLGLLTNIYMATPATGTGTCSNQKWDCTLVVPLNNFFGLLSLHVTADPADNFHVVYSYNTMPNSVMEQHIDYTYISPTGVVISTNQITHTLGQRNYDVQGVEFDLALSQPFVGLSDVINNDIYLTTPMINGNCNSITGSSWDCTKIDSGRLGSEVSVARYCTGTCPTFLYPKYMNNQYWALTVNFPVNSLPCGQGGVCTELVKATPNAQIIDVSADTLLTGNFHIIFVESDLQGYRTVHVTPNPNGNCGVLNNLQCTIVDQRTKKPFRVSLASVY